MEEIFSEYVSNFDMEDYHIKYKYNHSIRVAKICEALAYALNYNKEDIHIAKMIGLLHDIGRFEQLKSTGSYSDNDFDSQSLCLVSHLLLPGISFALLILSPSIVSLYLNFLSAMSSLYVR